MAANVQAAVDRQAEQLPVAVPHARETVLEALLKARQRGPSRPGEASSFFFSQNFASVGMSVRERR